ncbi:MAG: hypothetical protein AUK36_07920 [Zetaproteobacteria bacterium CG2_30_59_37]|nr:MAG: hypothetical protein AUK36_07920 [Zetaproteobacteria bacterium CG2_30_59_37]
MGASLHALRKATHNIRERKFVDFIARHSIGYLAKGQQKQVKMQWPQRAHRKGITYDEASANFSAGVC